MATLAFPECLESPREALDSILLVPMVDVESAIEAGREGARVCWESFKGTSPSPGRCLGGSSIVILAISIKNCGGEAKSGSSLMKGPSASQYDSSAGFAESRSHAA